LLNTKNADTPQHETFVNAFYYGDDFIQFSTFLNFSDSFVYGLRDLSNTSSNLMNQDDQPRRYVVWDNHNELPLITVQSKSTGKFFGLFLLTAGPAEIHTFP
jgi:hypothetical protein